MKKKAAGLFVLGALVVSFAGTAQGAFPASCPSGGNKTFKAANGTVDAVDPGKVDTYKITVTAGDHYVILEGAGDADMQVCKVGSGPLRVCYSHNSAGIPDGCVDPNGNVDPVFVLDVPLKGPGSFIIEVMHATDVANGGYPVDSPAPIPYALAVI